MLLILLFILLLILLSLWFGGFQKGTKESGSAVGYGSVVAARLAVPAAAARLAPRWRPPA